MWDVMSLTSPCAMGKLRETGVMAFGFYSIYATGHESRPAMHELLIWCAPQIQHYRVQTLCTLYILTL